MRERVLQHGCSDESCITIVDLAPQLLSIPRTHASPIRNDAHARIDIVFVMRRTSEGRRQMWRHHEAHITRHFCNTITMPSVLAIELVKGDVTNPVFVSLTDFVVLRFRELSAQRTQAVVELVHLAVPRDFSIWPCVAQMICRLQSACPGSVQRVHGNQAVHERQPQTQVHCFKDCIISISEGARIELLQTLLQKVHRFTLARVLANFVD